MPEIKILDSYIFNRIAAGEVVESPCSVVKELIENSIDAGADCITVEITGGGTEIISVTDNGKGIVKEDMPVAFLPHATSKIKTVEDLNAIGTLGFRGEALPSIASVSEVTMTSRPGGSETGYFITYQTGSKIAEGETGAAKGTNVTVKNIFQNIPARRKFLKKPSAEAAKITDLMGKIVLANPKISFKYTSDGKTVYHTDGKDAETAVYAVYGGLSENLMKISSTMPGITLKGFVSDALTSKHNRNYQTLIVNGRVVENEELSYSVYLAYKDLLMTRQFPVYILYLTLPYDLIDVNVHPNKTSIKFVDLNAVKKLVYNAVRRAVTMPSVFPNIFPPPASKIPVTELTVQKESSEEIKAVQTDSYRPVFGLPAGDVLCDSAPEQSIVPSRHSVMAEYLKREALPKAEEPALKREASFAPQLFKEIKAYNPVRVAGKLFNTYLMVQAENEVYIIDQHAAHERILYDRFIAAADRSETAVQDLLLPYIFDVSPAESEFLETCLQDLNALGFSLKPLGEQKFSLKAVPVIMAQTDLKEFVSELLSNRESPIKKSDFLKEAIAMSACKAAVKGKDDLSESEVTKLLDQMRALNSVPVCPHGRPTVVKLTKTEIEKWFKRLL